MAATSPDAVPAPPAPPAAEPVPPPPTDGWTPLSAALGLPEGVPPVPITEATEATGSGTVATELATATGPDTVAAPETPPAQFSPLAPPDDAPPPPPVVEPPAAVTDTPEDETTLGSHADLADALAAGSGDVTAPLLLPAEAAAAVPDPAAAVAVEVEPPTFDIEPPSFMTAPDAPAPEPAPAPAPPAPDAAATAAADAADMLTPPEPVTPPAPEPAIPAVPPEPPAPPAEATETTLRLSEILPNAESRGPALFGIQEDSTAHLSSELLNSASRLRAPLDQPVNPNVPAWQQPMGAALTTGLSPTSLTSGLGNFQPGPTDDLFRSRRVPSVADMAAAASAAAGVHPTIPVAPDPGSPFAQPPAGPTTPSRLAGAGAADSGVFASPAPAEPGPLTPGPDAYTPPSRERSRDSDRYDPSRTSRSSGTPKRGRGTLIAAIILIVAGCGLIALLMYYLFTQWTEPVEESTPSASQTAAASATPTPSPTPAAAPSPTPAPSEAAPTEAPRVGSLPADTVKVCEEDKLGVMGASLSCEVAANVAAAIEPDATGDFGITAYAAPLGRDVALTCTTEDTYYECVLTETGATYRVAFGREGQ